MRLTIQAESATLAAWEKTTEGGNTMTRNKILAILCLILIPIAFIVANIVKAFSLTLLVLVLSIILAVVAFRLFKNG